MNIVIDIIFFGLLLIGLCIGTAKGFIKSVCKIAGTVLSFVLAVTFCVPLAGGLENLFGLTTAIAGGVKNGTLAYWLSVIIAFVSLLILVKLAAWIIGKLFGGLVEKVMPLRILDKFLGGILGLAEMFAIILFLLLVFKWIGIPAVNSFLEGSGVVGKLYFGEWMQWLASLPAKFMAA